MNIMIPMVYISIIILQGKLPRKIEVKEREEGKQEGGGRESNSGLGKGEGLRREHYIGSIMLTFHSVH